MLDEILHARHKTEGSSGDVETSVRQAVLYSERLMALGAIEGDLAELWRTRLRSGCDDAAFEQALAEIVVRLDDWPVGRLRDSHRHGG
ncbi:hypothetical protein AB0J80_19535 [Actinoplanes sp. NPDC049548]|uniref:hypothetical protein n=1 Tax=Actinoplanes sp. NPDC049548 TaxID=3155152 RepID=UPI003432AA2A